MAKIERFSNGDLLVTHGGYSWRRVSGAWQMLSAKGDWFDCDIQDRCISRQVSDYENCLRSYTFDEGPSPAKGRRKLETVSDFIKRIQLSELRDGLKNIFATVPMNYTPGAALAAERASHTRRLSRPMPWRTESYLANAYLDAMRHKRNRSAAR